MTLPRISRLALQVITVTVVLYFWAQAVYANWSQMAQTSWQVDGRLMVISVLLTVVHLPLTALIWREALRFLGLPVPARWAIRAYLLGQVGRYVPGGFWDVAGRLYLSSERGLPKGPVSVTILAEMVLGVVSGSVIFLLSLFFWDQPVPPGALYLALASVPVGLLALHPAFLDRLLLLAARLLHRESAPLSLRYWQVLVLAAEHFAVRLLVGVGFYLFAAALTPLDWRLLPVFAGAYVAAWVAGFVVVFAPQGLGVREGVVVFLLSFYMPLPAASLVAVAFRVWLSVRDLTEAGIATRL